ncbi:MAG: hypothetical protein JWM80_4918 [Cyanobacteria bacterium RYN_339]|nr:hypothetical protein [Cyanobacteria bacterium RYN_339]
MFRHAALLALTTLALVSAPADARTNQPRTDRVVGTWRSSNGTPIYLNYTGNAKTLIVGVTKRPGDEVDYTGTWTSDSTFSYRIDGETVIATYNARTDLINAHTRSGDWSATWHRRR